MNGEVKVVNDVAAEFARIVASELKGSGSTFVLSGGSTATACYQQLAEQNVEWSDVSIFWGDERCVPLDHEDSNYLLAQKAMPSVLNAAAAVYAMEDADAYEKLVADAVPFDVVHLGVGDDGHVASLFPDSDTLNVEDRLVVDGGDEFHKHPRITLTYPAINSAKVVIYTVVGENKAEMINRVRSGEDLPVNRVKAERQIWLLDEGANGN